MGSRRVGVSGVGVSGVGSAANSDSDQLGGSALNNTNLRGGDIKHDDYVRPLSEFRLFLMDHFFPQRSATSLHVQCNMRIFIAR